jgi:thiol-disulfide isomerase/thioredoxin
MHRESLRGRANSGSNKHECIEVPGYFGYAQAGQLVSLLVGPGEQGATVAGATTGSRSGSSDRSFKRIALLAGVCLIGFIVYVAVRAPAKDGRSLGVAALKAAPPPLLHAGVVAPSFSLPRLGGGAPVALSSLRGSPAIVNFFASWCPNCRSELTAMGAVATQNTGRVAVVGIDSNDGNGATAAKLLVAAHATYPVGVDTSAKVASEYLLTALPVTYFVSADGRIVGSALGPQSVASLRRWVSRLSGSP